MRHLAIAARVGSGRVQHIRCLVPRCAARASRFGMRRDRAVSGSRAVSADDRAEAEGPLVRNLRCGGPLSRRLPVGRPVGALRSPLLITSGGVPGDSGWHRNDIQAAPTDRATAYCGESRSSRPAGAIAPTVVLLSRQIAQPTAYQGRQLSGVRNDDSAPRGDSDRGISAPMKRCSTS